MHPSRVLLIVSTLAASLAGCGQPYATGSGAPASEAAAGAPAAASEPASEGDAATASDAPAAPASSNTPESPSTPAGLCHTTATAIGYRAQAKAVIEANCAICHGGSTSPKMVDYASSKAAFEGGGLAAIADGTMPLGLTLSDDDRCILTEWAAQQYAE